MIRKELETHITQLELTCLKHLGDHGYTSEIDIHTGVQLSSPRLIEMTEGVMGLPRAEAAEQLADITRHVSNVYGKLFRKGLVAVLNAYNCNRIRDDHGFRHAEYVLTKKGKELYEAEKSTPSK